MAAVGAVAAAGPAHAASASAGVSATVIAPVVIAGNSDLAFSSPRVMSPGTAQLRGSMAGAAAAITLDSAARLTVSGDTRATYAVTIASTVTAARADGEGTVTIAAYVIKPGAATLSSGGPQSVLIGGRLMAGLSPARGAYAGNLPVMFEYD